MARLHQLLAAAEDTKGQAHTVRKGLMETFSAKRHLFQERIVTFFSNKEGAEPVTEEAKPIQSTIQQELAWIEPHLSRYIDNGYAINEANTQARADVILEDGTIFLSQVPGIALMELVKRVGELKDLVNAIPTLDPARGFVKDPSRPNGLYKAVDIRRPKTEKRQEPITLWAPPSPEYKQPPQVQLVVQDVVIGDLLTQEWSGLLSPSQKAAMLERCETLIRALKQALSHANELEVPKAQPVGKTIFTYIVGSAA